MATDTAVLQFRIKADSSQARAELSKFQGVVKKEVGDIAQQFAGGAGRIGQFASSLGPVGLTLGAVAGAAVTAGGAIFGLAKQAADAGSKFNDLSLKTGVSVETFSGLELQLKQSGTDMDALARAAVLMQKNLGEAAAGNKELQRAFAALGVKDVRAALADTDGTLRTVTKSLGAMTSAGERNAAGSKVMGRSFQELSVFLADTKGDLDSVIAESARAGRVMSTEAAQAADAFGDQLDALQSSASVAARSFGMEFVPEITQGMAEITDALGTNANRWREWGREVADVLRGLRDVYDSEFGQGFRRSLGWLWELDAITNPLHAGARQLGAAGAQSRAGDVTGNAQDLASEMARLRSKNTVTPPAAGTPDFFSPAAKTKREKDRKDELDKLKAFAKEWDFTITALAGGKHNVGSAHYAGRAMDVSVKGKSDAEIRAFMDAARQAGYGVRDERTHPEGQKVWSGPHLHLETQSKAVRAAVEAESKAFDEQTNILENLSRAMADADLELKGFTRDSVEQQIAAEYQRLGIGKLTGAAAELGEALFKQRAEQIKAIDAAEKHAQVLKDLLDLAEKYIEVVPDFNVPDYKIGEGPYVPPSATTEKPPELPFSGDIFEEWGKKAGEVFGVVGEQAKGVGDIISSSFGSMAQAAGSAVKAFILFGSASGSFRKFAAEMIASVAQMAIVQAVWEAAQGFAMLALTWFTGNPKYAQSAGAHFTAAGMYGAIGGVAAVAGRAIAGGAFQNQADGGGPAGGGGVGAGGFAAAERDRSIREGRRGGSSDPNEAQVMGYMMVDVKHDDGHVERQMTRVWRRMGEFRDTVMTSTVGTAPSY